MSWALWRWWKNYYRS